MMPNKGLLPTLLFLASIELKFKEKVKDVRFSGDEPL
jgi:hypothetical protein